MEKTTLGAGCFWCVETIFQKLDGVVSVVSGYSGGHTTSPTYKEICGGTSGHAEVCQVTFNPKTITFAQLLEVFWKVHDPTTLNQQGNDIGTQYRSVIFYHNEKQKEVASTFKEKLNTENVWDDPIVTEITAFDTFYPAEDYHKNYFNNNPNQSYCQFVVAPKVEKFKTIFADKLKSAVHLESDK